MSKKMIDWDALRSELLSHSDVQAAFDAEERKERLREMLAHGVIMLVLRVRRLRNEWESARQRFPEWKPILRGQAWIP
jgi:hypothetical protein